MSKLKILVAEDEDVTRQLLQIAFKDQERFECKMTANGEEALLVYKAWKPDLLLIDIMMPQMNGFETLKTIRQTLDDKRTPVIMISAVNDKQDIIACAKLGIAGYILKPFVTKTLAETVLGYYHKAIKGA